jgi:hypothetical protein
MAFRGEIWLFPIRLPGAVKVGGEARAFLNSAVGLSGLSGLSGLFGLSGLSRRSVFESTE